MGEQARPRKPFWPVVAAGLAASALEAVASAKPWYAAAVDHKLLPGVDEPTRSADMPLALALSLVVLASWGALLVTRGHVRRVVAGIGLVAASGVLVCVVLAPSRLPGQVRSQLLGASGDIAVHPTGWFFTAAVAAVCSLAVLGLAWWWLPGWPAMAARYDAPSARREGPVEDSDDPRSAWKALDEGRDPTDCTPD